ncbi:MAG: hypothetical protein ACUVT4_05725 [Actinomycetota bacterium]
MEMRDYLDANLGVNQEAVGICTPNRQGEEIIPGYDVVIEEAWDLEVLGKPAILIGPQPCCGKH